jgi:serine/threonine protein phosphatase 1
MSMIAPVVKIRAAGHIGVMLDRLFGRRKDRARPRAPAGTRIYAIGDIHGRADLLSRMHGLIRDDAAGAPDQRKLLIYLGDYVDRGEDSRRVIELLLDYPLAGFEVVTLCGNHEEMMLAFLNEASAAFAWMSNGGAATMYSYGVRYGDAVTSEERFSEMQRDFLAAFPRRHRDFLAALPTSHAEGDYLFVHAGIRPGVPVDQQSREDLLWIRDEFLMSGADHGCCVVHGHSIVPDPELRPNRIAIDTGAYFSNRLTCLVLEGEGQRFLQT